MTPEPNLIVNEAILLHNITESMNLSLYRTFLLQLGFPGGTVVKNLPADARSVGSIPGLGRSPEEEMTTHSSILAWKIPWTVEPGRLYTVHGVTRVGNN